MSEYRCSRCAKDMGIDWHYRFESISMVKILGLHCADCGDILGNDDAKEGGKELNDCPRCKTRLVWIMVGPPDSSMVAQARRENRYRGAVREPAAQGRSIKTG